MKTISFAIALVTMLGYTSAAPYGSNQLVVYPARLCPSNSSTSLSRATWTGTSLASNQACPARLAPSAQSITVDSFTLAHHNIDQWVPRSNTYALAVLRSSAVLSADLDFEILDASNRVVVPRMRVTLGTPGDTQPLMQKPPSSTRRTVLKGKRRGLTDDMTLADEWDALLADSPPRREARKPHRGRRKGKGGFMGGIGGGGRYGGGSGGFRGAGSSTTYGYSSSALSSRFVPGYTRTPYGYTGRSVMMPMFLHRTSSSARAPVGSGQCAPGCDPGWIGDRECDALCNNAACNWDNRDCHATRHLSSNTTQEQLVSSVCSCDHYTGSARLRCQRSHNNAAGSSDSCYYAPNTTFNRDDLMAATVNKYSYNNTAVRFPLRIVLHRAAVLFNENAQPEPWQHPLLFSFSEVDLDDEEDVALSFVSLCIIVGVVLLFCTVICLCVTDCCKCCCSEKTTAAEHDKTTTLELNGPKLSALMTHHPSEDPGSRKDSALELKSQEPQKPQDTTLIRGSLIT